MNLMNRMKSILTYELPHDFPRSAKDLESGHLGVKYVNVFIWTVPIFVELACAIGVAFFYLVLLPTEPVNLVWVALGAYFFTGVYLAGVRNSWSMLKTEYVDWWRLIATVIGWPVQEVIEEVHEDILRFEATFPEQTIDIRLLRWMFLKEIGRSGLTWLATFLISTGIAVFIAKAGLFPWS